MAGVLESLARGLRSAGGILSPDVQQQLSLENREDAAFARQRELQAYQQRIKDERELALANAVKPFIAKGDFEGAAAAVAQTPGGMEFGLKLREQAEARKAREAQSSESNKRQLLQFEQGLDLRREQFTFQRDQALRSAKTAEERAAFDRQYREQMLKLHEQGLEIKKSLTAGTQQQIVGNEGKLRDDYNQLSKTFIGVRDAHQRVMASANDPSAAGDLSLIFNYMKVLDPTSVVRESEFAQAASTGAFGERIKAAVGKVVSGERLSDAIRKDFLDRSERLYQAAEQNQADLEGRFKGISERSGVNPENVIIPYRTSKQKKKDDAGSLVFEGYKFPNQEALDKYKKAKGL